MVSLSERVDNAKKDEAARDVLVREYMPFILSCASKQCGRYIEIGVNEEAGIAMMAFDEAIRKYDPGKGGFLAFSKRIIARRLIDDYRKRKSEDKTVSVDFSNGNDARVKDFERINAGEIHRKKIEIQERQEEIEDFTKELRAWGITFEDLIKKSPHHERLRREYRDVATHIAGDNMLMDELMRTHRLPIKKLAEKLNIPPKKLERGRIYILSLVVVLTGDYRFIRDYIDWR